MKIRISTFVVCSLLLVAMKNVAADNPVDGWQNPPIDSRLRAYWWWLNGNVTRESITRDLEAMKAKGFGGAVLIDANGANQWGNAPVPHGPTFFSPQWRDLYRYTLTEANRLGLKIDLNIQSGWNLGGPMVTADDAAKQIIWSALEVKGPVEFRAVLPQPKDRDGYYRDSYVVAYQMPPRSTPPRSLENWQEKALLKSLTPFSAPDSSPLFQEYPATPGEEDTHTGEILDLTSRLDTNGRLVWNVPAGDWQIFRFGYTVGDHAYVSTASDGWQRMPGAAHDSYALDVYDARAFQNYWNAVVEPLIEDAGPLAGKTLQYLHTDSWEIENANWTPNLRQEFQQRNGYDMVPWLPVIAGKIVNSREESDRFLFDYRKTLAELTIDNHYKLFRDNAHKHGLLIHPESGGPHSVPIDAQRDLGWDDAPMSEFWAWSWEHRIGDANRFFVKQPASAAHTYGRPYVYAEGFTTIGPNWQERIWNNLKPSFDQALCEGMNLLVWHAFVCSPDSTDIPGQQYFAGTHLNPKVTWWDDSAPFFAYINRCQWMLQQGRYVADALYYYGDHAPNFAQLKASDPAQVLPGYDYDVITEEALLTRTRVQDGRIVLPDGMSYRVLVLPDRDSLALPVLRKLRELVADGATVIGRRPVRGETLKDMRATDAEIRSTGNEMWGDLDGVGHKANKYGLGRIIEGETAREVLLADGIQPDCEFEAEGGTNLSAGFDYIHRKVGDADIYFVANRSTNAMNVDGIFRVAGEVPELWNPVTGEHNFARAYTGKPGKTVVPLTFAPCGSWFVVFREPSAGHPAAAASQEAQLAPVEEMSGPWMVHFDPKWGGPSAVTFDSLVDWTTRPEAGIRYYSGTAIYEKDITAPPGAGTNNPVHWFLDLGEVHELAAVKVNGQSCGVLWCPPWRVEVTTALKPGENHLEIDVVNFWPNRIIGDASLPPDRRFTQTNIRTLTAKTPLMESGLLGPVKLLNSKHTQ